MPSGSRPRRPWYRRSATPVLRVNRPSTAARRARSDEVGTRAPRRPSPRRRRRVRAAREAAGRVRRAHAASRGRAPRRGHASALERDQSVGCELATDAVDRTRIEPVGTEPDLESGDASTGREPAGSEREDTNGHRDANDGEATHGPEFGARTPHPPRRTSPGARLQSGRCLPR